MLVSTQAVVRSHWAVEGASGSARQGVRVGSRVGVEMVVVELADGVLMLVREDVSALMQLSLMCFRATCKSVPVHACVVQFRADIAKTFVLSPSQVPNITP